MDVLRLRLDAPLMSFGGVIVDHHNVTDRFPGLSWLAGLLGNALGYRHGDAEALTALQERIEYAARWDIEPEAIVDYHTVDLGQPKMCEPGWTTRGRPEWREGGDAARLGTHQRYRHYLANGVMTLAMALTGSAVPATAQLAQALREPARPLFLGRKSCLPAAPLVLDLLEAEDVLQALKGAPRARRPGTDGTRPMSACWPERLGLGTQARRVPVYDRRDWRNQIHGGRRIRIEGLLEAQT